MSRALEIASKTVNFLDSIGVQNRQLVYTTVELATGVKLEDELTEQQLTILFSPYHVEKVREGMRRYTAAQLGCGLGLSKLRVENLMVLAGLIELVDNKPVLTIKGSEYGEIIDGKILWLQCTNKILRKYR